MRQSLTHYKIQKEVLKWLNKIHYSYISSSSVSECASNIQREVVENNDFVKFLWQAFSYWRGNIYVESVDGTLECLHREKRVNEHHLSQIRVPWFCIHRDSEGNLQPIHKKGYSEYIPISLNKNPKLTPHNVRDDLENQFVPDKFKTTSYLCYKWFKKPRENLPLKSPYRIIVEEGEQIFFRLFSDRDFTPSNKQIQTLQRWLKVPSHIMLIERLLSKHEIKNFCIKVAEGTFHPNEEAIREAWELTRVNPEWEMENFGSKNIIFFPIGRVYSKMGLRDLFFLGSFYYNKPFINNIELIYLLFSDLAYKGIILYQEEKMEELLITHALPHELGNAVTRIMSVPHRYDLSAKQRLAEILKEIEKLKELYFDWKKPERLKVMENISIAEILRKLQKLTIKMPYLQEFIFGKNINNIYVKANRRTLFLCLDELINNATKSMLNEENSKLEVKAEKKENNIIITISDAGCGLNEETFEQPKPKENGRIPEGLQQVKESIKSMGGTLQRDLTYTNGTKLIITFPILKGGR